MRNHLVQWIAFLTVDISTLRNASAIGPPRTETFFYSITGYNFMFFDYVETRDIVALVKNLCLCYAFTENRNKRPIKV